MEAKQYFIAKRIFHFDGTQTTDEKVISDDELSSDVYKPYREGWRVKPHADIVLYGYCENTDEAREMLLKSLIP